MKLRLVLAAATATFAAAAEGQSLEPASADMLWQASSDAVDAGEFDDARRDSLYRLGEELARRAVQADSCSSMAHFALAKALGRRALSLGVRDRVEYAAEVRKEALFALRLDSLNAGALHVMALWHAHVMSISSFSRAIAKHLLGARFVDEANWNDAVGLLERAAAVEPERIVHRLDLARVYADVKEFEKAREQYRIAVTLRAVAVNDAVYQAHAAQELAALR